MSRDRKAMQALAANIVTVCILIFARRLRRFTIVNDRTNQIDARWASLALYLEGFL